MLVFMWGTRVWFESQRRHVFFFNFILFIFVYVVLAQITLIEIVLVYSYYRNTLKTSKYNSYQQLQMDTQMVRIESLNIM
jgi:hypothetical protein